MTISINIFSQQSYKLRYTQEIFNYHHNLSITFKHLCSLCVTNFFCQCQWISEQSEYLDKAYHMQPLRVKQIHIIANPSAGYGGVQSFQMVTSLSVVWRAVFIGVMTFCSWTIPDFLTAYCRSNTKQQQYDRKKAQKLATCKNSV